MSDQPPKDPRSGQPPPTSASRPRSTSNPGAMKAVSAARTQPLPKSPTLTKGVLKEGAADAALNVAGVLRDTVQDFKSSDRYFKYKFAIIAAWLTVSAATVVVACPGEGEQGSNRIGAVVTATESLDGSGRMFYLVRNGSEHPWRNVKLIANGSYNLYREVVLPGDDVSAPSKELLGPDGKPALDLSIRQLRIETAEGSTWLVKNGQPIH